MFALINTYLDMDKVSELQPVHREWFDGQCRSGSIVLAGRQVPLKGGVMVVDVADWRAAEELADSDPYTKGGAASYEVIEFNAAVAYPERLEARTAARSER
jgi:uncharacterized protein YciI